MKCRVKTSTYPRPWLAIALLIALVTTAGSPASSQAQGAPTTAAGQDRATALFDQGNALYRQSKWEHAAAKFAQSFELRQAFDTAANLGDCELRLGRARDAAEHLSYALRHFPVSGKAAARQQLTEWLDQAKAKVGTLTVQVNVDEAMVVVDGSVVGNSPLGHELFVEPGKRLVGASKSGFEPTQQVLEVEPGSAHSLTFELKASSGPGDNGTLPGGAEPTVPLWSVIVAGSASVVLFSMAIAFRVVGSGHRDDADIRREELVQAGVKCPGGCAELKDLAGDVDTSINTSTGMFVAGGTAAVVSIVLAIIYATNGSEENSQNTAIQPQVMATPQGAGIGVKFRF